MFFFFNLYFTKFNVCKYNVFPLIPIYTDKIENFVIHFIMYLLLFTLILNSHSPYLGCAYKVFASLWQDFGLPTAYFYTLIDIK